MTLDDRALEYLQSGGVLTPAVGQELWRCYAVHSIAARLRKRGYVIPCKLRHNKETGRSYGEYRLSQPVQLELEAGIA